MRKDTLMASDLANDGRHRRMQSEVSVLDQKAPNSAKIEGWEEILDIHVQHMSPADMRLSIRNCREPWSKTMGQDYPWRKDLRFTINFG